MLLNYVKMALFSSLKKLFGTSKKVAEVKTAEFKEKNADKIEDVKEKVEGVLEDVKEATTNATEKLKDLGENIKEKTEDTIDKLDEKAAAVVNKLEEKLRSTIEKPLEKSEGSEGTFTRDLKAASPDEALTENEAREPETEPKQPDSPDKRA
jgi:hypothetical protein